MSALRLCVVGPPRAKGTHTSIGGGYERAARSLGIEVLPALVVPPPPMGGSDKAAYDRMAQRLNVDVRRETNVQRTPLEDFLAFRPDVIFFNEFAFLWSKSDRHLIFQLRRKLTNTAFVGMYWDEPWCWPITSRRTSRYFYDLACTHEPVCLSHFGRKAIYLPHAYDSTAVPKPVKGAPSSPLIMIANPLPPRVDWLAPIYGLLAQMGFFVIGNGWPFPSRAWEDDEEPHRGVMSPRISKEHAFWMVKRAKLAINLHRGRNLNLPPPMKGGWSNMDTFWNKDPLGPEPDDPKGPYRLSDLQSMNERVFDYSALGTLQVVDWRSYISEALPEIPTVTGPNDLVQTCRRLLADPKERRERMRKTWARVEGHHYAARLIYLLKTIGVADLSGQAPPGARLDPYDFSPSPWDRRRWKAVREYLDRHTIPARGNAPSVRATAPGHPRAIKGKPRRLEPPFRPCWAKPRFRSTDRERAGN